MNKYLCKSFQARCTNTDSTQQYGKRAQCQLKNFAQILMSGYRALFIIALVMPTGYAQDLSDPTRPAMNVPSNGITNDAPKNVPTALQSVILPKKGKPIAIINGRQVTIGDKIEDERVTKITENGVELKGANGIRVLKMSPDVEKKPSAKTPNTLSKDGGKIK